MKVPKVWTFFYGSYINFEVLKEVDLVPENWEVARLGGFDIRIEPRANLVLSDTDVVYGIAATATHEELTRLYAHAKDVLGELYLPGPVLIETLDGKWRAALCYVCPHMEPGPADAADVDIWPAPVLNCWGGPPSGPQHSYSNLGDMRVRIGALAVATAMRREISRDSPPRPRGPRTPGASVRR